LQDTVIYVNSTFEIVFGWAKEEVLGMTLPIVCEEEWPIFQVNLSKHQWEFTHDGAIRRRKDGTVFSSSETITPIKDRSGVTISYACIVRDITARKQAERTLKESEQRFKSLFEQNPDATLSLDLEGRMTDVNPATQSMIGFEYKDLLGKQLLEKIVPEERPAFEQRFLQTMLTGAQHFDSALNDILGNRVELNVKLLPIVIDKEIVGIYCIAKDVTAHNKALEMINFMAFYDVLTELPNRRLFQERLTDALRLALSNGQGLASSGSIWMGLSILTIHTDML
jgi:PAS domain S-box-containing protein